MTFLELAKKRFSVRKFTDQPVEKEKLDKVLEAGNIAPTAKNLQPQRIYVLQSEEALKKAYALTPCCYGAKTVLLFTYDIDEEWTNPLEDMIHSGDQDVSIVATHIMLEAEEQGLSTCWVNYFPNTKAAEVFGLPENEVVVLMMPIGYAAADAAPTANHTEKKPIEKTVRYL